MDSTLKGFWRRYLIPNAQAQLGWQVKPFYLSAILCACAVLCQPGAAQIREIEEASGTFDLDKDHLAIASLDGLWRFRFGDDPQFSDPAYDDSTWRMVRADQSWNRIELLPTGSTSFWYRTKVFIPADSPPLSLYIPHVETNYQVWIDGHWVGGIGGLPPHTTATAGISAAFAVSSFQPHSSTQPRSVSIAIRCYKRIEPADPSSSVYALGPGIRFGATPLIQQLIRLRTRNAFWYTASDLFLTMLNTLAALAAFGLFLFQRKEKEYIWYSMVAVTSALTHGYSIWTISHSYNWAIYLLASNVLWEASSLALMIFVYGLLDGRRDRLFKVAVGSIFINLIFALANFVPYMIRPEWKIADITVYNGVSATLFLPFALWVVTLICRKAIEGRTDARLLLPAVVLAALGNLTGFVLTSASFIFGWGPASGDCSSLRRSGPSPSPCKMPQTFCSSSPCWLFSSSDSLGPGFTRRPTRVNTKPLAPCSKFLCQMRSQISPASRSAASTSPSARLVATFFRSFQSNEGAILALFLSSSVMSAAKASLPP